MKSIKARYYYNAKKYDRAISLLNQGTSANPYLFFSENLKAQIFLKQGKIDSAFVNAKKAFYGLPKNQLHAVTFAQVLQIKRNAEETVKVFEVLSEKSGNVIWKNFLVILSEMLPSQNPNLVKYSSKAVELFPDDKELLTFKKFAIIGQQQINEASMIASKGLNFFNQKLFVEAGVEFEKAFKIDSLEYSHFENAASSYYMAGDYGKALNYSEKVIENFNPKTGKSEYISALAHISIGGTELGCELLEKSIKYGYAQAKTTFEQRCN
jgi:tetratricopeptide (TPR) repeat protein